MANEVQPHETYTLGAQSHIWVSFYAPEYTAEFDILSALWIQDGKLF